MSIRKLSFIASLVMLTLLMSSVVYGTSEVRKKFKNSSGDPQDSLHLFFNKSIKASYDIYQVTPFKSQANIDTLHVVFWGDTLPAADTTGCMVAIVAAAGLALDSASWSFAVPGDTIVDSTRLAPGDILAGCATAPTPFLGTWGIVALLILLAATAWFVLSRRKVRTTGAAA